MRFAKQGAVHLLGQHASPRVASAGAAVAAKLARSAEALVRARMPLQLQTFKPKAIKAIAPKLVEAYRYDKSQADPDRDRAELKKLKKKVARERKGVARELRKDGAYIAELREKDEAQRRADRREELKRNMQFMEEQAASWNQHVKAGGEVKGGGSTGVNMRGRRR